MVLVAIECKHPLLELAIVNLQKLSIKTQIVIGATLVGSFLLFTQTAVHIGSLRQNVTKQLHVRHLQRTKLVADTLSDAIDLRREALKNTAIHLNKIDEGKITAENEFLLTNGGLPALFDDIRLFNKNGKLLLMNQAGLRVYSAPINNLYLNEISKDEKNKGFEPNSISINSADVVISYPIKDGKQKAKGVLIGSLNIFRSDLLGRAAGQLQGTQEAFFLVGADRVATFQANHPQKDKKPTLPEEIKPLIDKAFWDNESVLLTQIDGHEILYAFVKINGTDMLLGYSTEGKAAFALVDELNAEVIFNSLFLFAWLIPLLWLGARQAMIPLDRLIAAMRERAGEINADKELLLVEERGCTEIKSTANAFNLFLSAYNRSKGQSAISDNILSSIQEGVIVTGSDNIIIETNPAFSLITGYSREEVIGKNPSFLSSKQHNAEYYQAIWKSINENGFWRGEIWNLRKDGSAFPEQLSITVLKDSKGDVVNYIGVITDITHLKAQSDELRKAAYYDTLTGLPNGKLLIKELAGAINESDLQPENSKVAIVVLDIDKFQVVNNNFGLNEGDRVLQLAGEFLARFVGSIGFAGRLSGDKFALVLLNQKSRIFVEDALKEMQNCFRGIDFGQIVNLTMSIGVTLYPDDREGPDRLLRHAEQALYQAKHDGANVFRFFEPEESKSQEARQIAISRIVQALKDDEFHLYYQPKVNLITGELLGFEALIRWDCPETGLVLPGRFLGFVENTRIEIDIGLWVMEHSFIQLDEWRKHDFHYPVSVNISAYQILSSGFFDGLKDLIARFPQINPGLIEIEILESAEVLDWPLAESVIGMCRGLGVKFSIDDFGTGYSSLLHLRRLPVDTLKIDQNFIVNMLHHPDDLSIIEGIVHLAEAFGKRLIAEGVETQSHAELLIPLGCHYGQGYGIARPMPPRVIFNWLKEWQSNGFWREIRQTFVSREILQLSAVNASHQYWVNQLIEMINERDLDKAPEFDSRYCTFNRWYQGNGKRNFHNFSAYHSLHDIHEALHAQGLIIFNLCQKGLFEEAISEIGLLMTVSERIMDAIAELKNQVMQLRLIEDRSVQTVSLSPRVERMAV